MLTLNSPAKINLFLRILKKRPDGYHELASLFQAVSLCDFMTFEHSKRDAFECSDPIPDNLVLKALKSFREFTGLKFPVSIQLKKNIPIEAGLGGGSSNAATTLFALNELAKRPLSLEQLASLGKEIGSDVPFFFSSGTAYCTGRGEIFREVLFKSSQYFIHKPDFGSSTQAVYNAFNPSLSSSIPPEYLLERFEKNNPIYLNDLEPAAFALNPALKEYREALLKKGYEFVLMSGSGSSFICKGNKENLDFKKQVKTIFRKNNEWYNIYYD